MNIYFLGGGNMATAIAGGLVKQDAIVSTLSNAALRDERNWCKNWA